MRRISFGWLLAGLCFTGPALAAPAAAPAPGSSAATSAATTADDGHVALFKNVSGTVKVMRGDAAIDAVPGTTLLATDRVVSGANASGGIVFRDGTLVTLGPSTEVQIRDYVFEPKEAKYQFSMYLAKGTAVYSSGKIGKLAPESVKVDTPTATVGVRGTRFILTAE